MLQHVKNIIFNIMNNHITKKYAVIGDPIAHSLSPAMHNAAFKALDMNAEYTAVHITPQNLENFVRNARESLAGFNVTVPHKQEIIKYLDDISEECRITGSVNTVVNKNGRLYGYSTDGYGLKTAIEEAFNIDTSESAVMFLGCGGTVKAVTYYLLKHSVRKLFIANRTVSKADELVNSLQKRFPETEISSVPLTDTGQMQKAISSVNILIQATSLGLKDGDPCPIATELLHHDLYIFDTIYRQTPLLTEAKKKNIPHADGSLMLVHQGAKAFSIWTGIAPPIDIMKKAVEEARQ